MEADKRLEHALQDCEDKLKHLEEENVHLRESSHAFGQLAERLNQTLRQERRMGIDRRQSARPSDDRRSVTVRLQPDTMHDRE